MDTWSLAFISAAVAKDLKAQDTISWASPMTNKAKSRTTTPSATKLHIQLVQDSPPTGTISGLVSLNQYVNFNQLHEIVSGNNTQIATKLQAFEIKPRNTTSRPLTATAVRGYNLFAENTELPFDQGPLARNGMYAQFTAKRTRAVAINKEADEIEDSLEERQD
ncbi:hypothetical protein LTR56_002494 [Elasticomyces elasticus]|nr:hypothetical protein LTR22_020191 [Elasticomyces elasticus]KAK3657352.1 hypothetical protein LTR56_002494 [Elasticomyces elasticus]KAK4933567.1 hypothetical protein LTR49_000029 [Elasticomyces elasticus]KAK5754792.1 hypothetical protein LTS12_015109 [Elasticomyces elasticus]